MRRKPARRRDRHVVWRFHFATIGETGRSTRPQHEQLGRATRGRSCAVAGHASGRTPRHTSSVVRVGGASSRYQRSASARSCTATDVSRTGRVTSCRKRSACGARPRAPNALPATRPPGLPGGHEAGPAANRGPESPPAPRLSPEFDLELDALLCREIECLSGSLTWPTSPQHIRFVRPRGETDRTGHSSQPSSTRMRRRCSSAARASAGTCLTAADAGEEPRRGHRAASSCLASALRLRAPHLAVGERCWQQPPPGLQEPVLPGQPAEPSLGDAAQAVEGAGELARHRRHRVGVVCQIGREQHGVAEVAGASDRPESRFEGVDDIAAGADLVPRPSPPASGQDPVIASEPSNRLGARASARDDPAMTSASSSANTWQASTASSAPWVVRDCSAAVAVRRGRSCQKRRATGASRISDPFPALPGSAEPASGSPVRRYRSSAARVVLPISKQCPRHEYVSVLPPPDEAVHQVAGVERTRRSPDCRPAPAPWPCRRSSSRAAVGTGRRLPCPPAAAASRGSKTRARCRWRPPTARPRRAPSARLRIASAVWSGTEGARCAQFLTWSSCSSVSIAPGRTSLTRRIASPGRTPSSTSRRAATVPARPSPPRQWASTSKPKRSRSRSASPASTHLSSKPCAGGDFRPGSAGATIPCAGRGLSLGDRAHPAGRVRAFRPE